MQTTARFLRWLKPFLVRRRRFFYAFGGLLGIFLLMNYIILPLYVNHGSRLSVPSVLGKPIAEAQTMLTAASLNPIEAEVRPDPVHQAGVVVYQNP